MFHQVRDRHPLIIIYGIALLLICDGEQNIGHISATVSSLLAPKHLGNVWLESKIGWSGSILILGIYRMPPCLVFGLRDRMVLLYVWLEELNT